MHPVPTAHIFATAARVFCFIHQHGCVDANEKQEIAASVFLFLQFFGKKNSNCNERSRFARIKAGCTSCANPICQTAPQGVAGLRLPPPPRPPCSARSRTSAPWPWTGWSMPAMARGWPGRSSCCNSRSQTRSGRCSCPPTLRCAASAATPGRSWRCWKVCGVLSSCDVEGVTCCESSKSQRIAGGWRVYCKCHPSASVTYPSGLLSTFFHPPLCWPICHAAIARGGKMTHFAEEVTFFMFEF